MSAPLGRGRRLHPVWRVAWTREGHCLRGLGGPAASASGLVAVCTVGVSPSIVAPAVAAGQSRTPAGRRPAAGGGGGSGRRLTLGGGRPGADRR